MILGSKALNDSEYSLKKKASFKKLNERESSPIPHFRGVMDVDLWRQFRKFIRHYYLQVSRFLSIPIFTGLARKEVVPTLYVCSHF